MNFLPIFTINLFLLLINFNPCQFMDLMNVELVFQLQKYFKSDLILIASKDLNLAKKFYKIKKIQMHGFIGTIDINENLAKNFISPYQNILVVLENKETIEKLIKVSFKGCKKKIIK